MTDRPTKQSTGEAFANVAIWAFLGVACALVVLPLVFMATASLMEARQITSLPYPWIPEGIKVENFTLALAGGDGSYLFLRNIFNSLLVCTLVTVSTVGLAALTGYGLAKFRFRGRNLVFLLVMGTMMIPFETIMIPLYMVVLGLNLQNTYAGLVVPFLVNAFGVFLMRQYLVTYPDEILAAARIDGAGEGRIFARVVLPNCVPAIATLSILTFRTQWDNLLWPLLVAQGEEMKTIPAYIVKFAAEKTADEGAMMAVAVIASLPIIVLFFTLSKYFVGGSAVYSSGKE